MNAHGRNLWFKFLDLIIYKSTIRKLEGKDVSDFWVRFEVLNVEGEDHLEPQATESDYNCCVDTSETEPISDQGSPKPQARASIRKKTSNTIKRMSLRRKKPRERSKTETYYSITPKISELLTSQKYFTQQDFGREEEEELELQMTDDLLEVHTLDFLRSRSEPIELKSQNSEADSPTQIGRKPKIKKNIAKTATR